MCKNNDLKIKNDILCSIQINNTNRLVSLVSSKNYNYK